MSQNNCRACGQFMGHGHRCAVNPNIPMMTPAAVSTAALMQARAEWSGAERQPSMARRALDAVKWSYTERQLRRASADRVARAQEILNTAQSYSK